MRPDIKAGRADAADRQLDPSKFYRAWRLDERQTSNAVRPRAQYLVIKCALTAIRPTARTAAKALTPIRYPPRCLSRRWTLSLRLSVPVRSGVTTTPASPDSMPDGG